MRQSASFIVTTLCVCAIALTATVRGQGSGFAIGSWTVDGGGGASEGGRYQLTGTIGQPDGGQVAITAPDQPYSLTGGFWQAAPNPAGCVAIATLDIDGPMIGSVGQTLSFAANIAPAQASAPIAFTWSPPPAQGQGSAHAQYRWDSIGNQRIVVRATNCGTTAALQAQHQINVTRIVLTGLEVTQGVQDLKGSVALIKDKSTFVRAHLSSGSGSVSGISAHLIAWRNGAILPGSPLVPLNVGGSIQVRQSPSRGSLNDSLLFALPQSWLNGTLDFQVVPDGFPIACADRLGVDNDCAARISFKGTPAPELSMIGIIWTDANNTAHDPQIYDYLAVARDIKAQFPIANLNWDRLAEISWDSRGTPHIDNLLAHINNQRTLDGSDRMYYGLLIDHPGGNLGKGYRPGDAAVGYYRPQDPTTASHELGHNFGRQHTNCSGDEGGPGTYPHDHGWISPSTTGDNALFGFHIYTQEILGPTTGDLMGYCRPRWVSDFTYTKLHATISAKYAPAALNQHEQRVEQGATVVLVSGAIDPTANSGSLETILVTTAQASTALPLGVSYTIRFEDGVGGVIAAYHFEPQALSEGDVLRFSFLLPYPEGARHVRLLRDQQVLDTRQISASAPTISLVSPTAGASWSGAEAQISWAAADADGDDLEYTLQYSRDGGATWRTIVVGMRASQYRLNLDAMAGTEDARIRVLASDGFNTATVVSEAFSVARKAPTVAVLTPIAQQTFVGDQVIGLSAEAIDNEDGLLAGTALSWRSDRDGDLGAGTQLDVSARDLSEGEHTITVTARDSDGQFGTASITVRVLRVAPAPTATLYLPLLNR